MNSRPELIVTKYAIFDAAKVEQHRHLLMYFKKEIDIPELTALLEEYSEWDLNYCIDEEDKISR
jgi:hypothetical protein